MPGDIPVSQSSPPGRRVASGPCARRRGLGDAARAAKPAVPLTSGLTALGEEALPTAVFLAVHQAPA